ncbi:1-deoxy-D-xylulose-5-phosphate reductoisomerase [Halarsenatibacter silvermanii]|uniref:1-deoxy-D-xylulose 5-phosphate reductoisomerase n=1 Tax=Halarsenatibacter silvermanii TaxID=321763 RepID=A0A1G9LGF7_9FIRM|nr:1-deoxy-D-xylulose-5-phosphate reductoisomerase [Halarsenatibacter silvermanii]SDL61030.1 1-deoxy-D-xylulose 5-phosphate reductoisomerase [Halarsenatibacter silvermanii]
MKKLVLLGATGSIGEQTLEILAKKDDWSLLAASCCSDIEGLLEIINRFQPKYAAAISEEKAHSLEKRAKIDNLEVLAGEPGYNRLAGLAEADLVINAIMGAAGLKPTLKALRSGQRLGLANKESLVTGGSLISQAADKKDAELLPVDSEHNAIFQLLEGKNSGEVRRLVLTASGGPFHGYSRSQLADVDVAEALDHPNWDMGSKITIDSATLMNKGLEVIEARWLFDFNYDKIDVMVHPESIVHSLIELTDNTFQAELGAPDMKKPIEYVISYPDRSESSSDFDLFGRELSFKKPDRSTFPCLDLAYESGRREKGYPVVLNAANEMAVAAFLDENLNFMRIPAVIETMLAEHDPVDLKTAGEILELDRQVRQEAREVIANC